MDPQVFTIMLWQLITVKWLIKLSRYNIISDLFSLSEMEVKSVPTEVFGSLKNEEEED
jgi:hypothetical protein